MTLPRAARVVIRTDASARIGTGHVMRCLTLADALRDRGASVQFLCRAHEGHLASTITARGHACALLPPANSPVNADGPQHAAWLGCSQEEDADQAAALVGAAGGCDLLVVDHYALHARWERTLRPHAKSILAIDDLADRDHDVDFLLDQNFYLDADSRYAGRVPVSCRKLVGPRYALLRTEFSAVPPRTGIPARAQRLFVFFGGIDATGETLKTLDALALLDRPFAAVDVVIGPGNPRREEVLARAGKLPGVRVSVGADDMAARMAAADLALGAGGTTTWERCATGLPSIVLAVADNQVKLAHDTAVAGLHLFLGTAADVDATKIACALALLADNAPLRQGFADRGRAAVDSRGAARVARLLLPAPLDLRRATTDDCDRVWAWRNAPENREHAHDSAEIPLAAHRAWFARMLADPQRRIFLVASDAQGPVGVLRYDENGGRWTVSIYLVSGRHNGGLGTALLQAGTAWLRRERPDIRAVHAEVLDANAASAHAFEAAGYRREMTTYVLENGS